MDLYVSFLSLTVEHFLKGRATVVDPTVNPETHVKVVANHSMRFSAAVSFSFVAFLLVFCIFTVLLGFLTRSFYIVRNEWYKPFQLNWRTSWDKRQLVVSSKGVNITVSVHTVGEVTFCLSKTAIWMFSQFVMSNSKCLHSPFESFWNTFKRSFAAVKGTFTAITSSEQYSIGKSHDRFIRVKKCSNSKQFLDFVTLKLGPFWHPTGFRLDVPICLSGNGPSDQEHCCKRLHSQGSFRHFTSFYNQVNFGLVETLNQYKLSW